MKFTKKFRNKKYLLKKSVEPKVGKKFLVHQTTTEYKISHATVVRRIHIKINGFIN